MNRDNQPLHIRTEPGGIIRILSNNLDLAGDLIQSLGNYLGLEDLSKSQNRVGKIKVANHFFLNVSCKCTFISTVYPQWPPCSHIKHKRARRPRA